MIVEDLAPQYPKNDKGWIQFPPDVTERHKLFPPEVMHHPAKMHLGLCQSIIDAYTKPGDRILDPFGGTGTTGIAALQGREIELIELETDFVALIQNIIDSWTQQGIITGSLKVWSGDNRQVMAEMISNSFSRVITSPPYARTIGRTNNPVKEGNIGLSQQVEDTNKYAGKSTSGLNFGRLNAFLFDKAMKSYYEQVYRVLKPGGLYISVTKDYITGGKRNPLGADTIKTCQSIGLKFTGDWFKWAPPGTFFKSMHKSRGTVTVDDEDIIVFQK